MGEINWGGLSWQESFEGVDGTALATYDANWTVNKAGASLCEIDTAQKPSGTGTSSLLLYRDGVNSVDCNYGVIAGPNAFSGLVRVEFFFRAAQNNARGYWYMYNDIGQTCMMGIVVTNGTFYLTYGDGAAGVNWVIVNYSANTNYEVTFDLDTVSDKCRWWINGVLKPGSNANATGWDKLAYDRTVTTYFWGPQFTEDQGTGSMWYDDFKVYTGWTQTNYLGSTPDPKAIPSTRSTPVPKPGGA